MKHIFIVNPIAGKGKTLGIIPEIEEYFKGHPEESYEIHISQRKKHAIELAGQAASRGSGRIYSVGGDGTLNEVLNGMAGSDYTLGVIPMGSGNDFVKTLSPQIDLCQTPLSIIHGAETTIDYAKANDICFINIASVGLDAEVARNTNLFKKLPLVPGSLAYILSTFYTIIRNKPYKLTCTMNGVTKRRNRLLVAVCNGKYYGGGFMPAPDASLSDGLLDICGIDYLNRINILKFFPKFRKGNHESMSFVTMDKTPKLHIIASEELSLNLDGEVFAVKEVVFELFPKALKVLVPR